MAASRPSPGYRGGVGLTGRRPDRVKFGHDLSRGGLTVVGVGAQIHHDRAGGHRQVMRLVAGPGLTYSMLMSSPECPVVLAVYTSRYGRPKVGTNMGRASGKARARPAGHRSTGRKQGVRIGADGVLPGRTHPQTVLVLVHIGPDAPGLVVAVYRRLRMEWLRPAIDGSQIGFISVSSPVETDPSRCSTRPGHLEKARVRPGFRRNTG